MSLGGRAIQTDRWTGGLTAWCHFGLRERLDGDLMSPAKIKVLRLRLHVKCSIFLPDFNQIWIQCQYQFHINIKFHGNPSSGSRTDIWGQTDMTKIIRPLRHYANTPNLHKYRPAAGYCCRIPNITPLEYTCTAALSYVNCQCRNTVQK